MIRIRKEMTRKQMIICVCVLVALVGWLVYVSQSTCDPGEDCSALGILFKLLNGIRELI